MVLMFNKALRILLITNGAVLLAGAMLGPIYALFVGEIGGSLLDASITVACLAVAAGGTSLLSGRIADRSANKERIVATGYGLMGLGFLLYTIVGSFWGLLAVQLLIGFAEALYAPSFDALFSMHVTRPKAGREWGTWESMNYFYSAVGAAVGGVVVTLAGFTFVFAAMCLLCVSSATYILLVPKRIL